MKNEDYDTFVEKFKPKKTTDDCYTPPEIYDTVMIWACRRYGISPGDVVRPFWPGEDYRACTYPERCAVIDNPPFSILTKICEFYLEQGIPFFLFAPSLTAFSGRNTIMRINHIICNCDITYENGAVVPTSFVTNMGDADIVAETAPDLTEEINRVNARLKKEKTKNIPKYDYPDYVITAAKMGTYAKYGIRMQIRKEDCTPISRLDAQRESKKEIFGGGLLLSERAAAERAAAERAAAERAAAVKWQLSDREKEIVRQLGQKKARN